MLKQEKAVALEQADREKTARLAQMQASADELQAAVRHRTAELARANLQLSARERELQHAAFHDPLTDLANRRYLIERVDQAMSDSRRRDESLVLMLIDLDHFKPINDRYGHDAGDLLLHTLAQRLREQVRAHDLVARLGGDEFAVLICGPEAHRHARDIALRLLAELALPVPYDEHLLGISVSIGAALFPRHAEQFAGLYKAADEALYRAKQRGRSGFVMQGDEVPAEAPAAPLDVLRVRSGLADPD
ncbi:putative signaling protein [compost metagenome]